MTVSNDLRTAFDSLLAERRSGSLVREVERLIETYRGTTPTDKPVLRDRDDATAYASYRMPATFGAVGAALAQFRLLAPDWEPESQADIGGGTGAAAWAAAATWDGLRRTTVVDWSQDALELGGALARTSGHPALRDAQWQRQVIGSGLKVPDADLVTVSYVLGELTEQDREAVVAEAAAHGQVVAVVEPGTLAGYRRILRAREQLLAAGMTVVAPCPHGSVCPVSQTEADWCHFAVRINRSAAHRSLKGGSLPYEDEKYSYVVASRTPQPNAAGRVLRHPALHKGMVVLSLCTERDGLEKATVTKRQGPVYKAARNTDWGDAWPPVADGGADQGRD